MLFGLDNLALASGNGAGIVLLVLALILFVADVHATTHGALTFAGVVAFIMGAMLILGAAGIQPSPIIMVALALLGAGLVAASAVLGWRVRQMRPGSGPETLLGRTAEARTPLSPRGKVFVDGAFWNAVNIDDAPIGEGDPVLIAGRDGLTLQVRRADPMQAEPVYVRQSLES